MTQAQATDAKQCLQQQLGKRLSAEWLANNGMTGITEQAVAALLAEFTTALRDAGPAVASTLLAPTASTSTPTQAAASAVTLGDRKRRLGENSAECWADAAMYADDD